MSALESRVRLAMGEQGSLASSRGSFRPRSGQLDMALAVARAIEGGERLVVEAGTGVGKTFAYLVPLLLSGRRALLSTATQALQDQLSGRDIPAVSQALGMPVRVAVLKGRSSYVCLHRLELSRQDATQACRDPALVAGLDQVQRWAMGSDSGDLAELTGLGERSPLIPLISSTRDNCLGAVCPRAAGCHVNRARQAAHQADWVVVNHHLFLADLQLRGSGQAELLPVAGVVVLDEAHQLNDTVVQMLGQSVGQDRLVAFARDLVSGGVKWARGMYPWAHLALGIERAAARVSRLHRRQTGEVTRIRWTALAPEGLDATGWTGAVAAVKQSLAHAQVALGATAGAAADLKCLQERSQALLGDWVRLTHPDPGTAEAGHVRWMEWTSERAGALSWRLVRAPVDGSQVFRQLAGLSAGDGRSWVFTSATLGDDESLSWFTGRLGLGAADRLRSLRVPSPFDHARQSVLYVPHDLPEPADPAHTPALAQAVARWATRIGGRTLVLTTTLRAAGRMASCLETLLSQGLSEPLKLLVQGRMSRRALLSRFRAAASRQHGAVLVASASFWEGVDLPGDVLQLLVIDKLPFPSPDDALTEARARQCEASGLNAFQACYLPAAAQSLKQGAGRLIRSETDRGVLVIADRRLVTRSYGNALLSALPPMGRLLEEPQLLDALDALSVTRASTRDRLPA